MSSSNILRLTGQYMILCIQFHHLSIKLIQPIISQIFVLYQIPLSPAIFVTPIITLPWKIYPLRMTKLITHEIEIDKTQENRYRKL